MEHLEAAHAGEQLRVVAGMAAGVTEHARVRGSFDLVWRRTPGGIIFRRDKVANVVTDVGANYALDTFLAGSGFTVVGPYLGLISSTSFTAVAAANTMTSHAGWLEAGNANAPAYSGTRKTAAWSAASARSKALSAGLVFTFTSGGTVQGLFLVLGTGALNTIDNTAGTLYSAGTLGTPQPVIAANTVTASYTATL